MMPSYVGAVIAPGDCPEECVAALSQAAQELTDPLLVVAWARTMLRAPVPADFGSICPEWSGTLILDLQADSLTFVLDLVRTADEVGTAAGSVRLRNGSVRWLTVVSFAADLGLHAYLLSSDGAEERPSSTGGASPPPPGSARIDLDSSGVVLRVHDSVAHLVGLGDEELVGSPVLELMETRHMAEAVAAFADAYSAPGRTRIVRALFRRGEEERHWVETHLRAERSGDEVIVAAWMSSIDEAIRSRSAVEESERIYQTLSDSVPIGAFHLDGRTLRVNDALRRALDVDSDLDLGSELSALDVAGAGSGAGADAFLGLLDEMRARADDGPGAAGRRIAFADREGAQREVNVTVLSVTGQQRTVMGTVEDTSAATRHSAELAALARTDSLTGLANRFAVEERLAELGTTQVGVLFIDIDRFKEINDRYGHGIGDRVLIGVADRIDSAVREQDFVARLGGDEFLVIGGGGSLAEFELMARRVLAEVVAPLHLGGVTISPSASLGVASGPADAPDALFQHSDLAMYEQKRSGAAGVQLATGELLEQQERRQLLGAELPLAISEAALSMHYQPFVDLETGVVRGAEGLLRWHHPRLGRLNPAEILRIAQSDHLMGALGRWGLQRVLSDRLAMELAGRTVTPTFGLGLNLSADQLAEPGCARHILSSLEASGLSPDGLVVEIIESQLIDEASSAEKCLTQLSGEGIRLAIDDFGTGFSSLTYLTRIPLTFLKLDARYVAELDNDERTRTVVSGLAAICTELGVMMIAEGIERPEIVRACLEIGLLTGQGYLIGRPAPIDEIPTRSVDIEALLAEVS